jgi:outer membrane protein assembly factor BamE (lipoprotein component of BamABCDE complex)
MKLLLVALGLTAITLVAVAKIPEEQSQSLDRIAKRDLHKGMTAKEVRSRLGKPQGRDSYCNRAEVWTYVTSQSGTWSYVVVFIDGRLELFGEANPQWFGDDDYPFPGGERVREIVRAAQTDSCGRLRQLHGEAPAPP